ncbi:TVP38/TMEM64 family protein [Microbacterium sp. W4I20]|uniref:TVP38/TMEM64 family protein n=1 Tax=Microbacterium sp. W4I20 TaxID=3042262 RepID=UPI0027831552|nr:TVP38/TMEM64 family protein [Microbacterium sp. W4I20]MDQ0726476.1 putative membrane protein YdjX (TVP38/TMEM64 family) [Microbacterium sp. W4I20]
MDAGDSRVSATSSKRRAVVRLLLLLLFVALVGTVGFFLAPTDLQAVREWAAGFGPAGAVVFVLGYAALTLTPVPKNLLTIAAGLVWGFWLALALVYVGALLGAAASFVIGRMLGREAVERLTGARVARLDAALAHRGFLAVLGARLVPIIPFTLINYGSGLTAVRPRAYALGTALGILPGSAAYVALGAFGLELGPPFWVAVAVLGVLILGGVVAATVLRRRSGVRSANAQDVEGDDDA